MRTTFVNTLLALAKEDPTIMLITGDLGYTVLERYRDALPKQYLNAGVAEQNMIGVAAGLAMCGYRVFVYSIIPFATFRCLEHTRNDVCYHHLNVCVVGVGGGFSYGYQGSTHHALEDVSVMRSLPNMTVVCPGDPLETEAAVRAIAEHDGPCYLRLGKAGEPALHQKPLAFALGKAIEMRAGSDVTIIATSTMLETAVKAADELAMKGIAARLLSMHTVKPIDRRAIERAAAETKLIATVEEHSRTGGLGSAVAEVLSELSRHSKQLFFAAPDRFAMTVGSQTTQRRIAGIDLDAIVQGIEHELHRTVA